MFSKNGKEESNRIMLAPKQAPRVSFDEAAILKMQSFVALADIEVAWLCFVETITPHEEYYVYDCELLKQDATSVTAEIDETALIEFGEKLLNEDRTFDYNNLRGWGHSHVKMAVNPSGTDDDTFKQLYENCEYFIRIICNKDGVMRVDFVDTELEYEFDNIDYTWIPNDDCQQFVTTINEGNALIDKLQKQIEEIEETNASIEEIWNKEYEKLLDKTKEKYKEEVELYCKPKYKTYNSYTGYSGYDSYSGYNYRKKNEKEEEKEEVEFAIEDILEMITEDDIELIATSCVSINDVREWFINNGYSILIKDFTHNQLVELFEYITVYYETYSDAGLYDYYAGKE